MYLFLTLSALGCTAGDPDSFLAPSTVHEADSKLLSPQYVQHLRAVGKTAMHMNTLLVMVQRPETNKQTAETVAIYIL